MAGEIAVGLEQPFFVVAQQEHDLTGGLGFERQQRVHAPFAVGPAVDVVAQEHDRVVGGQLRLQLAEQVTQGREIPVDVADGERAMRGLESGTSRRPGLTVQLLLDPVLLELLVQVAARACR